MNSHWPTPFTDPTRGTAWSPERIDRELELLRQLQFFKYTTHSFVGDLLQVFGTISVTETVSGRVQSLYIRMEYPSSYPRSVPQVFDHEKVFTPSTAGHQFSNHRLCLSFPLREEFTRDSDGLSTEILGASLIWLDKRSIFERTTKWPGDAEDHSWTGPLRDLLREEVKKDRNPWIGAWTDWIIAELIVPNYRDRCPCQSGRVFALCHARLLNLASEYLLHSIHERELYERRPTVKAA
jgi:hypothetical protein